MRVLEKCEPKKVFQFFEEICSIPHGSGNTKQISDYYVEFAKNRGLKYVQDEINNIIIYKNATKGYENAPTVILQGHMDMVCASAEDKEFDFLTEGLELSVEGDWIKADRTTLGGDNSIAIAMALAVLDSDDLAHPAIEAVFTVDEETGLYGAKALDFNLLKGRWLLNLDSEDEKEITVSCAGGVRADSILPVKREEKDGVLYSVTIDGLLGGHSGMEINKGRGSANQLMGRLLYNASLVSKFTLVSLNGGVVENAIALKATADVLVEKGSETSFEAVLEEMNKVYKNEYAATDSGVAVSSVKGDNLTVKTADETSTKNIIFLLYNLPHGVFAMCTDFPEVTETSLNMGVAELSENEFRIAFSVRSSVATRKEMLKQKLAAVSELVGGKCEFHAEYPAWEYKRNSPLRDIVVNSYKKVFGSEPVIAATHGGLECGLFSGKAPDLDSVSFGPCMKDVHTPLEKLSVSSTGRVFALVTEILKNCK